MENVEFFPPYGCACFVSFVRLVIQNVYNQNVYNQKFIENEEIVWWDCEERKKDKWRNMIHENFKWKMVLHLEVGMFKVHWGASGCKLLHFFSYGTNAFGLFAKLAAQLRRSTPKQTYTLIFNNVWHLIFCSSTGLQNWHIDTR